MESKNTVLNSTYKIEITGKYYDITLKVMDNSFIQLNYEYETYRGYIGRKKRKSPVLTLNDLNFPAGETKPVSQLFPYRSKSTTYMEACIESIKFEMLKIFASLDIENEQTQVILEEKPFYEAEQIYLFNVLREVLSDIFVYCQETGISIRDDLKYIPAEWTFDIKDLEKKNLDKNKRNG